MMDISSPKYDKLRNWIRLALENGFDWNAIRFANQPNIEALKGELKRKIDNDFWPPNTTVEIWWEVVNNEEEAEKNRKEVSIRQDKAMLTDKSEDGDISAPTDSYSSWSLYKKYLIDSKWNEDSIKEIESATVHILRRLKVDTIGKKAVKGLVVGHVQSGKTANMAALMAMAADWGWNMFIVLSGTIDNLRMQTQSRLYNDLNRSGNIVWDVLKHLSLQSSLDDRLQNLNFNASNNRRYFTVCLKNSTRLENLIKWMQADKNKLAQMKIIVIDDESDQGSINTAKAEEERSKINKLIVNLVEGNKADGTDFDGKPLAMNYIGYTATPYANFLNESHPKSLYPSSFIRTLQPSDEYFGAKQIFGIDGIEDSDGLDIVRTIDEENLKIVKKLHNGSATDLPNAIIDSLAWFLCAAAAMRFNGYKKPISMLVHTSQKQDHHSNVAQAIGQWLRQKDKRLLINRCKEVWEIETNRFNLEAFQQQFTQYPNADLIMKYPAFEDLQGEIMRLISEISHIPMDEENQLTYHEGIHLCIDNCANNGITEENMVVRLAYPDSALAEYPSPAPAFIVVGGSTLARGLTIEGLVSTVFLRSSNQADTLMQMGRWFGYRKKYELYPRIWMTEATENKFKHLTQLEYELRDDLKRYMNAGSDPSEFGPRVKAIPSSLKLKITAANRMKNAITAEMDFSGTNAQTVVFSEEINVLNHNIIITDEFLESLGEGVKSHSENSIVWRDIPFDKIKTGLLLDRMKFHNRAAVFNQIEAFCEWYEQSAVEAEFTGWNIIAAGNITSENEDVWKLPGGGVSKIQRSRRIKKNHDNAVSVGVLRAPKDLYEDIDANAVDINEIKEMSKNADNNKIMTAREKAGLTKNTVANPLQDK